MSCSGLFLTKCSFRVHAESFCRFARQNSIPEVVFNDPTTMKKGTQTVTIVMIKALYWCSLGIFVMPKMDVTKVRGKKQIVT